MCVCVSVCVTLYVCLCVCACFLVCACVCVLKKNYKTLTITFSIHFSSHAKSQHVWAGLSFSKKWRTFTFSKSIIKVNCSVLSNTYKIITSYTFLMNHDNYNYIFLRTVFTCYKFQGHYILKVLWKQKLLTFHTPFNYPKAKLLLKIKLPEIKYFFISEECWQNNALMDSSGIH